VWWWQIALSAIITLGLIAVVERVISKEEGDRPLMPSSFVVVVW